LINPQLNLSLKKVDVRTVVKTIDLEARNDTIAAKYAQSKEGHRAQSKQAQSG
jgi:hypothetical protein